MPVSKIRGYIAAIINDTHRELLSTESITFTFIFDREDRLLVWKIRPVYTGP